MKKSSQVVDVIVPVYNAAEDLRRCVESVRRCTHSPHRVILIDDASPDPAIKEYFEELRPALPPNWVLLRNERNQGFVGTCNRGMALSENDVVLLNSDTVVTPRWLEKLKRCADSDPRIGTITPFSNNAEICSFPEFCANNPWPETDDPDTANEAFENAAVPTYPDLPTGVGFCFYITRALLRVIGGFDAEFGLGYGEENDLCMRAVKAGYRNVLCEDTFVLHLGHRSFDDKKTALVERNMGVLLGRHPDYLARVTEFIRQDPLRPFRDAVKSQYAILKARQRRPGILHIQHGKGGGTENHIRALIKATRDDCRHCLLTAVGESWELEDHADTGVRRYHFRHQNDEIWTDLLEGICGSFSIGVVHVHHISGCREGLLAALAGLSVPYGITVHDFFLACPTTTLLDANGGYCAAETDLDRCQQCLNAQSDYRGLSIQSWRRAHAEMLRRASFIFAPSKFAAATLGSYFPGCEIEVIPHGFSLADERQAGGPCTVLLLPKDGKPAVGVLGAIGPVKGARLLEQLVERTKERGMGFRWVLVGYMDRQYQPFQDSDCAFTIHGPYRPQDVPALLDHYGIELLVFPSLGPETFSFTLSEVWAAGRPALVPPVGALGERMIESQGGWIMRDWTNVDSILDDVCSLISPTEKANRDAAGLCGLRAAAAQGASMGPDTSRVYLARIGRMEVSGKTRLAPVRVLNALRTAQDSETQETRTVGSILEASLLRLAHIGLRMRYTRLGRLLYRIVPQNVQRDLKRRLLA